MSLIPQQRLGVQAAPALAFLGLAAAFWTLAEAQPAAAPPKKQEAQKPKTTIQIRKRLVRNKDGGLEWVIETVDENGKVTERRGVGMPPAPPAPLKLGGLAAEQGTVAVNEKYVFVLLAGVLYQYDAETLKLKNKVPVTQPARETPTETTRRTVTRIETTMEEPEDDQPRVSLDLQNADLRDTLRMLAKQSKAKIVVGDGVQGKITASLRDMPLAKALDSILTPQGMAWHRTDDGTFLVEAKGKAR